jgi:hypothetical protein
VIQNGKIAHAWPKVLVDGHAEQVLAALAGEAPPAKAKAAPAKKKAAPPKAKAARAKKTAKKKAGKK